MAASNAIVADVLRRYAALLALNGADRFKVKAYRRAAETIETLNSDIAKLVASGFDLTTIPTVGKAIGRAIQEIVETGSMPQLDKVLSQTKPELIELASRPSLDPKKVSRIYKKLKIHTIDELRRRLETGEIHAAFGSRIAFHIQQGLDDRPRLLLYTAEPLASKIESYLRSLPGVTRVSCVGSLRRKKDTVGDLNFLVATNSAATVLRLFADYGGIRATMKRSRAEATFIFSSGIAVNLFCTRVATWGAALVLRTGSLSHLADLKQFATENNRELPIASSLLRSPPAPHEKQVYRKLGLDFIEPELREGRGEVQAAANGTLPKLVTVADLCGDLHMHTIASDGANSIPEMAKAARHKGYQYIAITDHSQSLKITNGLSEKRLLEQIQQIDAFNARQSAIVVLKSAEVDILEDGSLDYSNALLKELDFTICSIHSRFSLNSTQQTERIMRAMDNRYFNILGHTTGRLLLRRQGYEVDIERLIAHAKSAGCYFEINSSPDRLDLSDEHARLAKQAGVQIAINTDAHSIAELKFIAAGINQARRAWLEPRDVLNALPLEQLIARFRR